MGSIAAGLEPLVGVIAFANSQSHVVNAWIAAQLFRFEELFVYAAADELTAGMRE